MSVEDGTFIVKQGSTCVPPKDGWIPAALKSAPIENNKLLADVSTNSPSTAGWIVLGHANNGWMLWKDKAGNPINIYRQTTDVN